MSIPPSTRRKVEQQQQRRAIEELSKVRLCSRLVMGVLLHPDDLDGVLRELRAGLGPGWNIVQAFEYMSGQEAYAAILLDESAQRTELIATHRLAKVAAEAQAITRGDLEQLRMVCMKAVVSMGGKLATLED